jgi:hypothetical protein
MTQQDIVTQSGYFLWKNKLYILLVILAFSGLSIYVAINNIKFEKKKMKVAKVLVVEKMTTAPPSLEELNTAVQNETSNNETCKTLSDKSGCTALGGCVWVTSKNNIKKCVAAQALGAGSTAASGSDGPTDMCYCAKDGKLVPWEEYYYLDGSSIQSKAAKPCTASGDSCTYTN